MKRLVALLFVLTLSGCASTQGSVVLPKWPDVPADLKTPATELTPLDEKQRTLSDLLSNVNANYTEYYVLKEKYEAWQSWYNSQQKIVDGLQK
jgi:hypothetical protein